MLVRHNNTIDLATELVCKMPQDLFDSEVSTFVDPSIATGAYLEAVSNRLSAHGHRKDNINSRLFAYGSSKMLQNLVKKRNNIEPTFIQENFLETNMKFNVVLGNPPYQGKKADSIKQWVRFTRKACEIGDVVAFVTPNSALVEGVAIGRRFRDSVYDAGFGFVEVKNHEDNPFPTVGIDTCHWIVQRNVEDKVDPVVFKSDPMVVSICSKVVNDNNQPLPWQHQNTKIKSKELLDQGTNEILFSGNNIKYTNEDVDGIGELKVVFPFSVSYNKAFISDKPTGLLNYNVLVNSVEEGELLLQYTMSKLFRYVAKYWNRSNGFVPFVRRGLVDLRRNTPWTDDELYSHFNITEEEREVIEKEFDDVE